MASKDEAFPDSADEWESIEVSLERWDILVKNFHCLAVLKCLPRSPGTSLQEVADTGKSFYRERVWLTKSFIAFNVYFN